MPTPPLDEPITQISVKIFTSDLERLKSTFGPGWSGQMRMIIHDHFRIRRGVAQLIKSAEASDAKRD
jgi:hypothetical protein